MKTRRLTNLWFPAIIRLIPNKKEWKKNCKKFKLDKDYPLGTSDGITFINYDKGLIFVVINSKLKGYRIIEVVAHEVSHVVDAVLALMNETNPGEEFKAYAQGYLTREMVKQYRKWYK